MKHPVFTTTATALSLLLSAAPRAGDLPTPGAYRPVEGQINNNATQGQFAPSRNTNTRWNNNLQPLPSPVLPAQPPGTTPGAYAPTTYAAPGYHPQPTTPDNRGWTLPAPPDPTRILDDFFGSHRNEPHPYPAQVPVAPLYVPPVPAQPAQPPGYGTLPQYAAPTPVQPQPYTTPVQPQYTVPSQPQYGVSSQPQYATPSQPQWGQPAGSQPPPAPLPSTTLPQHPQATQGPRVAEASQPKAPRPYANPQESGANFAPRPITIQPGRNDPRFRPPELKGTP